MIPAETVSMPRMNRQASLLNKVKYMYLKGININANIIHSIKSERQQGLHLQPGNEPRGDRDSVRLHGESPASLGPADVCQTYETKGAYGQCESSCVE